MEKSNLLSKHNPRPESSRTGYYKIGKTTQDVNKRISDLQGGNPHKMKHLESHQVPDMDEAEQRAHHATQSGSMCQIMNSVSSTRNSTMPFTTDRRVNNMDSITDNNIMDNNVMDNIIMGMDNI